MYEFLIITLDMLGKVMISYTAIRVHFRFWKEHKIDDRVFATMKSEQIVGLLGILFIIGAYILELLQLPLFQ